MKKGCLLLASAGFLAIAFPRPTYAVPSASAVGCADLGNYFTPTGLLAKAVVKTTTWLLFEEPNVWVPFEPVGSATGEAVAKANVSFSEEGEAQDSSAGIIFETLPGGGLRYDGVTAGPVSRSSSFPGFRSASAKGEIYALPVQHPQSQGAQISSVFTDNTCKANVVLTGIASGAAGSNTDPFVYPVFDTDQTVRVLVDLVSNYPATPNAAYGVAAKAFAEPGETAYAKATTSLRGISNLGDLFDLSLSLVESVGTSSREEPECGFNFTTGSSVSLIDPISSLDFTCSDGLYAVSPSSSSFAVSLTIPAGEAFRLDIYSSGVAIAAVGVPGPLPLLGVGAAFGFSRKLRKRIKSSKTPEVMSAID